MKFAEQYSYNEDGSVRGEFVTKELGVIPLSYSAKMFGVNLMEKLRCKKSDFRGLIFGVKYINDGGLACDSYGNPLEDSATYALTSEVKPEEWDFHLFLSHDGNSALDDEEWAKLSPEDQAAYRKVDCLEVELAAGMPINGPVYLCKEAVVIMTGLFMQDVRVGDPINKRYQYECQHNTAFAAQYGFVLNIALKELERDLVLEQMAHEIGAEIFAMLRECFEDDEDDESQEPEQEETKEDMDDNAK